MTLEKYELYNKDTGEIYGYGYNEFTAMHNLEVCKSRYGESVAIKWLNGGVKTNDSDSRI